jgi:hypothetical protein
LAEAIFRKKAILGTWKVMILLLYFYPDPETNTLTSIAKVRTNEGIVMESN